MKSHPLLLVVLLAAAGARASPVARYKYEYPEEQGDLAYGNNNYLAYRRAGDRFVQQK